MSAAEKPPFPNVNGTGIRVAVIDSGLHAAHDHIDSALIAPGAAILPDGTVETEAMATQDRLGHGTAVTAAIQEKAPGAQIIPVRVFHHALKTSGAAILSAIRWSLGQGAHIINLSLGSTNPDHRDAFARMVTQTAEGNAIIVAAHSDQNTPYYPGSLDGVVGVQLDWDCPREYYRTVEIDGAPIFLASGYPRPIPGVPMQRNLAGISFAVSQMAGFTALACAHLKENDQALSIENVRETLCDAALSSTT